VEKELKVFALRRERNGSIDHVTGSFLLGADGREVREYERPGSEGRHRY